MGCFDSTCAISNYPVHAGDKVVCFYLTELESEMYNKGRWHGQYGGGNTYNLSQLMARYFQYEDYVVEKLEENLSEERRIYLEMSRESNYPFKDIVVGEYDDYGNVEGVGDKYDNLVWFFIRYEVWEFFANKFELPVDDYIHVMRQIIWVCYIAHHDITMAGTLVGDQYYQLENMNDYTLMNQCRSIASKACFDNIERFLEY